MSDPSAGASIPCIAVPRRFDGATLSNLANAVVAACPDGWPPELILDFERLDFIQPAGVIFLSNLICWLNEHGTTVRLIKANRWSTHRPDQISGFTSSAISGIIWACPAPARIKISFGDMRENDVRGVLIY